MMIEKKFPRTLFDTIYAALSFMQKWSYKLKEEDQLRLNNLKEGVLKWLKSFKASSVELTDVCEL